MLTKTANGRVQPKPLLLLETTFEYIDAYSNSNYNTRSFSTSPLRLESKLLTPVPFSSRSRRFSSSMDDSDASGLTPRSTSRPSTGGFSSPANDTIMNAGPYSSKSLYVISRNKLEKMFNESSKGSFQAMGSTESIESSLKGFLPSRQNPESKHTTGTGDESTLPSISGDASDSVDVDEDTKGDDISNSVHSDPGTVFRTNKYKFKHEKFQVGFNRSSQPNKVSLLEALLMRKEREKVFAMNQRLDLEAQSLPLPPVNRNNTQTKRETPLYISHLNDNWNVVHLSSFSADDYTEDISSMEIAGGSMNLNRKLDSSSTSRSTRIRTPSIPINQNIPRLASFNSFDDTTTGYTFSSRKYDIKTTAITTDDDISRISGGGDYPLTTRREDMIIEGSEEVEDDDRTDLVKLQKQTSINKPVLKTRLTEAEEEFIDNELRIFLTQMDMEFEGNIDLSKNNPAVNDTNPNTNIDNNTNAQKVVTSHFSMKLLSSSSSKRKTNVMKSVKSKHILPPIPVVVAGDFNKSDLPLVKIKSIDKLSNSNKRLIKTMSYTS